MNLKQGDLAPQFTLKSSAREDVSLQDFKGQKVIILFFPGAYSSVCTAELCTVRDEMADYKNLDAVILAISVDSLFTLNQFKQDKEYPFTLLSDFNKEVCQAYGAYYEEFVFGMKGVARRAAFVVDGDGIIRYAEVLESGGDMPNFAEVKNTLASIS
ncbi:MAG: redoxin domain-containing protein [Saprospiraceae bacterium]|jgi:peroxiredoxin|nr:redoxin domain-containing protein [Saprospiraceae bacterium]